MRAFGAVFSVCVMLSLAGCGGDRPPPDRGDHPPEFHPPSTILEKYDANHDGIVTRKEMEEGLRVDFAKADVKKNGCLNDDEVRAVNQQRWDEDQSTASPLVDFKGQGCIDFDEFAATARSLFAQMDLNEDGKLTKDELHPPRGRPLPR